MDRRDKSGRVDAGEAQIVFGGGFYQQIQHLLGGVIRPDLPAQGQHAGRIGDAPAQAADAPIGVLAVLDRKSVG